MKRQPCIDKWLTRAARIKAAIRVKVEHSFHIIKYRFRLRKVSYRGLSKNTAQLCGRSAPSRTKVISIARATCDSVMHDLIAPRLPQWPNCWNLPILPTRPAYSANFQPVHCVIFVRAPRGPTALCTAREQDIRWAVRAKQRPRGSRLN